MSNMIKRFMKDESGATMVEYAVLVALIAVAVIATVYLLGDEIDNRFNQVLGCIKEPSSSACSVPATE